jgi:hypothetical protein
VFSTPQRRRSLSLIPLGLRFSGRRYTHGGAGRGGPGRPHHTTGWRDLGLARATRWCGPLVAHLALSFWLLQSSDEIWISRYFPGLLVFRNMVSWWSFFQQNPDSDSELSNNYQSCKNRENNISIISKYEIYQWITANYDIK